VINMATKTVTEDDIAIAVADKEPELGIAIEIYFKDERKPVRGVFQTLQNRESLILNIPGQKGKKPFAYSELSDFDLLSQTNLLERIERLERENHRLSNPTPNWQKLMGK